MDEHDMGNFNKAWLVVSSVPEISSNQDGKENKEVKSY